MLSLKIVKTQSLFSNSRKMRPLAETLYIPAVFCKSYKCYGMTEYATECRIWMNTFHFEYFINSVCNETLNLEPLNTLWPYYKNVTIEMVRLGKKVIFNEFYTVVRIFWKWFEIKNYVL